MPNGIGESVFSNHIKAFCLFVISNACETVLFSSQFISRNNYLHHLISALQNLIDADITQVLLNRVIFQVTISCKK